MLKSITYHIQNIPITQQWSLIVDISRNVVGSVCEALHGLAQEMGGCAIYYPNVIEKQTICRYEWPLKWQNSYPRFHIAISLVAGSNRVENIDVYLIDASEKSDAPLVGDALAELVDFSQKESVRVINKAFAQLSEPDSIQTNVVFYLDFGTLSPLLEDVQTEDKKFNVIRTYLFEDHKRISAVTVNSLGINKEMAKATALRDVAIFSALMTLGAGQLVKTITVNWDKKTPVPQFVENIQKSQARYYYPKSAKSIGKGKREPLVGASILFTWRAYNKLSISCQSVFMKAIFAYQAAKDLMSAHSTLSIIAFIASLSAISEGSKKKCDGVISCSKCGDLSFKHDLVGDKMAVVNTMAQLLNIKENAVEYKSLKRLMQRVYGEQRSAYVHSATLRHNEYFKQMSLPTALPTNTQYVSDVFFYARDLFSIEPLVRQTLLRWLELHSGEKLPENQLRIDEVKIERNVNFQSAIHLQANRAVNLQWK